MRLVIADTGPVNYLILIGHVEILPALFEKVILPSAVKDELSNPDTPLAVRRWIADSPAWVELRRTISPLTGYSLAELGAGETAAIQLAVELHADLLLMDDRRGVTAALQRGLTVTGTMGLLARAAKHGILDLADAFEFPLPAGNYGPVAQRSVGRSVASRPSLPGCGRSYRGIELDGIQGLLCSVKPLSNTTPSPARGSSSPSENRRKPAPGGVPGAGSCHT